MSGSTRNTAPEDALRVAVGVIGNERGEVLIARRPACAHQGDLWEFPGGKCHDGEDVPQALRRELYEELGIRVRTAMPMMKIGHAYPDRHVVLEVFHVTAFEGQPAGREAQPLRWVPIDRLRDYAFPAANTAIIRALQLPSLYAISHFRRYGEREFLRRLELALEAGLRLVQFREPQLERQAFTALAGVTAALCHRYGARLLVNAAPEWVTESDADGVHLNGRRLRALSRRPLPGDRLVAASCHDAGELQRAAELGADFAVLSPVRPTSTHPHGPPLGWDGFRSLRRAAWLPVYALGGMQPADFGPATAAGAHGIAMITGLWEAPSIADAVRRCQSFPA